MSATNNPTTGKQPQSGDRAAVSCGASVGLSAPQVLCLMAVDCYGALDRDDGEKVGVHGAALSALLNSLAARDLLRCIDGVFCLTDDGAALIERMQQSPANDDPAEPVADVERAIDHLTRSFAEDAEARP